MIAELVKKFGTFSEAEIQILENRLVERKVLKGEALLKLGEVCQSIFFINIGAFIQYNFKNELEQNIIDLYLKNDWILNQQSLVRQEPSETIIEAFVESYVFVLNLHTLHDLIAQSPAFLQLGKIFEPTHSRIQFFDNSYTPAQKYEYLMENRKEIIQTFPLKTIAAYLKITPETLSRVREKIARPIS